MLKITPLKQCHGRDGTDFQRKQVVLSKQHVGPSNIYFVQNICAPLPCFSHQAFFIDRDQRADTGEWCQLRTDNTDKVKIE